MDFFTGFFSAFGGVGLAYLGSALAVGLCCVGSAKGTGMTGEAATGVIAETPEQFSKCMILQVLPGTQGLYGIVAWFMVMLKILDDTAEDDALGGFLGLLGDDVDGGGGHAALSDGGQQAAEGDGDAGAEHGEALLDGEGRPRSVRRSAL